MKNTKIISMHDLQLFAKGGPASGTAAGTGAGDTGVTASAAGVQLGVKGSEQTGNPAAVSAPAAEVQNTTVVDRKAQFEKLITGEYRDLYNAKVKDTVQKRLKAPNEAAEKYKILTPALEILARKYGIRDASDTGALLKAIQGDNSLIEDAAMEAGMELPAYRRFLNLEQQNAEFRRQAEEARRHEQGRQQYDAWTQQAEQAKHLYPGLDLAAEIQNQKFVDLLHAGVDVRSAYEVVHKDDIISGAMRTAAQIAAQKVAQNVAANGARPSENGSGHGAATVKTDVSKMTKAQRQELILRVARGERISF